MPRQARKRSKTGIYHIIVRGINRQIIFADNEDYVKFINIIHKIKEKSGFKIYGYCLMGNHVHLLLHEGMESISLSMQRICSSFVYWYNWKNEIRLLIHMEVIICYVVIDIRSVTSIFHRNILV